MNMMSEMKARTLLYKGFSGFEEELNHVDILFHFFCILKEKNNDFQYIVKGILENFYIIFLHSSCLIRCFQISQAKDIIK